MSDLLVDSPVSMTTKYLARATLRREGLFWLTVEGSAYRGREVTGSSRRVAGHIVLTVKKQGRIAVLR